MGFPVTELISDSLNKYTAVLFGDGIFSFLRTEIRISFEKFLRVNKVNLLRQLLHRIRILIPNLMLHMLDNTKNVSYRVL